MLTYFKIHTLLTTHMRVLNLHVLKRTSVAHVIPGCFTNTYVDIVTFVEYNTTEETLYSPGLNESH